MKDNARKDDRPGNVTPFLGMAFIALLAHIASTELHESIHLIVGRLVGLPSHFLSLTSVGVTPSVAATTSPSALAWMNGVAPLATMLIGIVSLIAMPALRAKAPAAVADFVAWWAIFGVPYIGLQTMTAPLQINLRGNGSDFAAVLGGYFGLSLAARMAIALAGLVIYMASGFWLGPAVAQRTGTAPLRLTLRERLRGLAAWRLVAVSLLGLLLIGMTLRYIILLVHASPHGMLLLFREPFVWFGMLTLLVRWRSPGARDVLSHWILPGVLASAVLIAIGWLNNDDFLFDGIIYVLPLIATGWIQTTRKVGS